MCTFYFYRSCIVSDYAGSRSRIVSDYAGSVKKTQIKPLTWLQNNNQNKKRLYVDHQHHPRGRLYDSA